MFAPDFREEELVTKALHAAELTEQRLAQGGWTALASLATQECIASGYILLKGKCYSPTMELPQKTTPTSVPGKAR